MSIRVDLWLSGADMMFEVGAANGRRSKHDVVALLLVWLGLAAMLALIARQNFSVPGLYYDEAIFGGLAKDFVTGQTHHHMPGVETINLVGHPFPVFVQSYLGALKSWMSVPTVWLFGPTVAVLRLTTLSWALLALLFLMLGVQRWLGLRAAIIAGATLIIDPTYFFLATLDWGAATNALFWVMAQFEIECSARLTAQAYWRCEKTGQAAPRCER